MKSSTFTITNTTKAELPSLAFVDIKNAILGKEYELSLTFLSKAEIKKLNKKHRNINEATDILSFPLSDDFGEIYMNIDMAEIESKKFGRNLENFIAFLFIHGLLHLKGLDHSSTMESIEAHFRNRFGI